MNEPESVQLTRKCDATAVPYGTRVSLEEGETAQITQSLGGAFTVVVQGNMYRIEGKDGDALGKEKSDNGASAKAESQEELEQQIWAQMKCVFDPEIPVNIVDLGLIYDCRITAITPDSSYKVEVKMTLTAPGCGMGDHLRQDVENKLISLEGVDEVDVELVWEPQWNQSMMSEAAQLQLGMY